MRNGILFWLVLCCCVSAAHSETVRIDETPFGAFEVAVPEFANRDFAVTDYGAKEDVVSTEAFAAAMKACASAGGGRVVVPRGSWRTGAVRLQSNCNLHLEEGAVLEFTDDPDDYPEVMTTWEGVECRNHSPLVYAYGCTNVAVTGKGTLSPKLDRWRDVWAARTDAHMKATEHLYFWCSTNCPVAERRLMALPDAHMRPHLFQFNRCRRVLLEGIRVRGAPFWTLHLFLCADCLVRELDVCARGLNNDGLDIEMSRNVLVEKCRFDQGDDGIVLKAGRNADGWRLATPTENVVIRDCDLASSESMLGIGSELSGGIRNVWMTRCRAAAVSNMLIIKTGRRRGGFVENICFDHCTAKNVGQVLKVFTQYTAQWGRFPDFDIRRTPIRKIRMSDCSCVRAKTAVLLEGDVREPVRDVVLSDVTVDEVEDRMCEIGNCQGVDLKGLRLGFPDGSVLLPRKSTLADVGSWTNRFPEYAAAVAFLGRRDLRDLPCGTYRLDGERTVAQIREEVLVPLSEEAVVHVYPDRDAIYAKLTSGHYMFTTGPDNECQHFGGDGVFCVPAGLAHTCARTHGRPRRTRVCVIFVRR